MTVKDSKTKKYELVAPDGGWGYMVGLGVILNLTPVWAFANCFGIIFKDLFIQLGMDSRSITLFSGISAVCTALSGFLAAPILKFVSLRKLGLFAAILFNLGLFGAVFVRSLPLFFICQGILPSIGNGMLFNLSCTILNTYFVKKRLLAFSFTQTFVCLSGLVSPQFVKWSLESYGYQGTLLLISAFSLHTIMGMFLMQPVEWHMKKIEISEEKEKEMTLLLQEDSVNKDLTSSLKVYKIEPSIEETEKELNIENNLKKQSSRVIKLISHCIDVPLLKSFLFSNISLGLALSVFAEITFTVMLPQALYFMGWSEGEVAWAMSMNALGDLVTRILFIFMSSLLPKIGSDEIYVAGLIIAFITRLGMLWSDNRKVMLAFITIMGISKCTIVMLAPVVIADTVGQEKFTLATGLFFLLLGFFNLTVGPIVGAVRDMTDSYATAFYILTSCFGIVVMFWSIELLYKKNKHKRHPKTDDSSKP